MHRQSFVSAVSIVWVVALIDYSATATDPSKAFPIVFGYIQDNKAITTVVSKIPKMETPYMVFHEAILKGDNREVLTRPTLAACGIPSEPQFRWKMGYGVYWNPDHVINPLGSSCIRFPIADLPDYDVNGFAEGQKRLAKKYKNKNIRILLHLEPLTQKLTREVSDDYDTEKNQLTGEVFSFDCLPVSATDVLLFTLHRSQLTIWYGKDKQSQDDLHINFEWTKRETMAAGFQEHFRVEGDAENYYFVTRSGRVFASLKPPVGRPMRVEVLWSDTVRRVRTLIADANTGRTFVFAPAPEPRQGEEPGRDKSVYFELTPAMRTKDYDTRELPANKFEGRVKTVVSHVDFLIEKKQIVLPAPKP